MPKKKSKPATKKSPPFKLAKRIRTALPEAEREGIDEWLWGHSGGLCALCSRALSPEDAEADHILAKDHGGKDVRSNLHLAHKTCNRSRGNTPIAIARPIVEFKAFCDEKKAVTFDDVIDRYLVCGGQKARQPVKYLESGDKVTLDWGAGKLDTPVFEDPATKVKYFFAEIPTRTIQNDVEVQPRLLMYSHVRALALDFTSRPVHEPSNCRLVLNGKQSASLLQFDGQHKTTAQILLGRSFVPMKIYINPDIAMVQGLVVKIQQEIKKQPLTRSDTLAKLGDVIKRHMEVYLGSSASPKTERGFIEAQDKADRKAVKKLYEEELLRLVFFDDDNALAKVVRPGAPKGVPSDKVVIDKIIRPLLHLDLLEIDMEAAGGRDTERELVLSVLNVLTQQMFPKGWDAPGNEVAAMRANTFFYQGSIGWWMEELLWALRYVTQRLTGPLFINELNKHQRDAVVAVVERLCELPIWSTKNEEILKAMRSHTLKNLKPLMPKDAWKSLVPKT